MSVPLVNRVLPLTAVFLSGVLAASMLGASAVAAPSVRPSATQERSVSCHGFEFRPLDMYTGYNYSGALMTRGSDGARAGSGFFTCDPHLPDRAIVTRVRFTLKDANELAQVRFCGLDRSSLKPGSAGAFQTLGQVSATGMAAMPGIVRKSDSTIDHATVDTTDWAYWLQCRIEFEGGLTESFLAGIYGADVTYRISSTNG